MMLRGHFGSVELIRGIFNPSFRRNLSAASIRYAEDKNGKKADGVFSWLKDIFRADDGIQEARKVTIDRGPVTVLDYPETNQACLTNSKLHHVDNQGSIKDSTSFHDNSNYINYEQRRELPRHDLLTLSEKIDTSIRTIMDCTPRNTKPPIREPNMPEKQEKKDEKKEKKKKKPVIRMEGGLADSDQNDPTVKAEQTLHDNLDVNFRHQWGVRLPEEMERSENAKVQQSVGSSFQVPVYDAKDLQVTMSSSKDSDKIMDAKTEGQMKHEETAVLKDPRQAADESESSKEILNASPGMMAENSVVDEDYNIPSGTNVDAEVSAWKELVLRSKIPLDPSKEEFVPEDGRRAEMLSIRPEAPRPKLDVQAVPTSNDQAMDEEEDETEFSSDVRTGFKTDTGRIGNPADVQKLDSKKLHTGSVCFTRKAVGFVASQRTLDFSTSTDSGWGRTDQTSTKESEQPRDTEEARSENRLDQRSSNMEIADQNLPDNEARQETLSSFEQQKQARMDQDFRDSLNSIADREMEISMSSSRDEDQNMWDEKHVENERSLSDDFQASFDYASSPYENDFYPQYESMSLEPEAEKSTTEKSKESQESIVASSNVPNDEEFVNPTEEYSDEYISDGNYIRVPGDPYPYSREHFYKWTVFEDNDARFVDIHSSVRKLNNDTRASTLAGTQETESQDTKGNKGSVSSEIGISEGSKQYAKSKDKSATHVETIQPDIHLLNHEVNTNVSQRDRKDEPSSLIQKPKVASDENQKGLEMKDIHALRNEQLSLVSKDEIEKIYELKNYAYLRAEEMKNFQLNLKSKLRTTEQETSVTKNN